uniref:Uncharacterized protein n=1 Tax=Pristionchus pacificus TaxID=54126 RepID=A0A2A6BNI7_PRIPA|eukprot:PDM67464.1 hypothetical protein PRIPAC_48881 [Pristionchus pacificus]
MMIIRMKKMLLLYYDGPNCHPTENGINNTSDMSDELPKSLIGSSCEAAREVDEVKGDERREEEEEDWKGRGFDGSKGAHASEKALNIRY